jgi:putative tricarboxylic transport membrane protein
MIKYDRQLRLQDGLLLGMTIIFLLFIMAVDSQVAYPAADYPSRPIEYVVHTAPGSANYVAGSVMSDIIQREKILSQPLVIVHKPGSGGAVASAYLFEKKANPYVVMIVASSSFIITPLLEKLPYSYKSFVPIANMFADGSVMVVRSDSPFKTINDIIAEAKKRPKELILGGGSFTSIGSMMGRSIQKLKGVQWNFISFQGGDIEAVLNTLSGTVHFAFANPSYVLDHVRAGKLRVVLTGFANRFPEFKDAPTMKEAGLGEPLVIYRGIVGPPNMPDFAETKLEAAFKKVMDNDRFKKYLSESMMQPLWLPSAAFGKLQDKENDQWKVRLTENGLLKK